jgi:hypothetical protein
VTSIVVAVAVTEVGIATTAPKDRDSAAYWVAQREQVDFVHPNSVTMTPNLDFLPEPVDTRVVVGHPATNSGSP